MVHCGDCSHEWAAAFLPMNLTVFAKVAKNALCPMCGSKKTLCGAQPKAVADGDVAAWIKNGDTGISSETIWSVLSGCPVARTGFPLDPADFGRCYRLLKAMPGWRARLGEVADKYPEWRPLVDAWDELTTLYEEEVPNHRGRAPKLYSRMQKLTMPQPERPAAKTPAPNGGTDTTL